MGTDCIHKYTRKPNVLVYVMLHSFSLVHPGLLSPEDSPMKRAFNPTDSARMEWRTSTASLMVASQVWKPTGNPPAGLKGDFFLGTGQERVFMTPEYDYGHISLWHFWGVA